MISEPEEHIKFIMEGSPNHDFGIAFYDDTTQRFRDISNSEVHEVLGKIQKYWAVQAITPIPPFFVVEINTPPPKEDRPLLIADLISVFVLPGEPWSFGLRITGDSASGSEIILPPEISNDLKHCHIPSHAILVSLFLDWSF